MKNKENPHKKYWSTLSEYNQDAEFKNLQKEEFLSKPQSFFDYNESPDLTFSRRDILKLAGAAAVFAAAACARRPVEKIVPYLNPTDEVIPGKPDWYASTCGGCSAGCGVLVKTREARPIKLEGNPDHPLNNGTLCARGQASILDLYDPDRLRNPVKISSGQALKSDWKTADFEIASALKTAKKKIVLLTGSVHGPAQRRLIREFLAGFPNSEHVIFDSLSEEEIAQAQEFCFGTKVLPRYLFDKAEVLVLLGADPLAGSHSVVEFAQNFGLTRKIKNNQMSKVISFEPALSLTGSNADLHFLVKPQDLIKVALGLANQLIIKERKTKFASDPKVHQYLKDFSPEKIEAEIGLPEGTLKSVANELWSARGKSLVYAGGLATRDGSGVALQIAVSFLNSVLENEGVTVDGTLSPSLQSQGSHSEMLKLISEMKQGKVEIILIYGTNPAYCLPGSAEFAEALKNVKTKVYLGDRVDETGSLCDLVLPSLHALESWGDAEPQRGLYSLFQPTIAPLFDNRAWEESLLAFAREAKAGNLAKTNLSWHDYLKQTWQNEIFSKYRQLGAFEDFWVSVLRQGVFDTVNRNVKQSSPRMFNLIALTKLDKIEKVENKYTLSLYTPAMQFDGRNNNNAWLLEAPDPVSKISWDNYVNIAPQTAKDLNLSESDVVQLTVNGMAQEIPVHIQPGVHPQVLTVAVGWGREKVGRVGNKIGVNAFKFAKIESGKATFSALPVEIRKTSKKVPLASVQGHNYINGRPIIYEASLEEYQKNPTAGRAGEEKLTSMWPSYSYEGYRWGMAIDLNSCIGCNACMLACQAENNIPVVGKEQVLRGREMAWIRIDRYYSGKPDHPEVVHQPMLCQHCENAPCETVCPVIATLHNDEGLNLQIYNRCVGTRYCSNNCPYKVRRFNWFEYNQNLATPLDLVLNPDVTVRTKGVMEKCTFCIQRIREAKEKAKSEGRTVQDGQLKTACQQTCPTQAIVFGDLNDPESQVTKLRENPRGYHVLEILNTRPSITYLTKIRNRPAVNEKS